MATITRSIHNTGTSDLPIFIPGYDNTKASVVVPASSTLDLFTVLDVEQLSAIQPELAAMVAAGAITVALMDDSANLEVSGTVQTLSQATQVVNTYSLGGASVKNWGLELISTKALGHGSTGDSNDSALRLVANNYAVNDSNFILRGLNSGINNKVGGSLYMLDNSLGCQNKGAALNITGLHVLPENFGTVANEFGGIRVQMKNEGSVATLEYGVRVDNINDSLGTKIGSAYSVGSSSGYANTGFTTGLNLNGATLTNEIVFSNGTKVTVSGDTVTFTNAAGTAHLTLTMVP